MKALTLLLTASLAATGQTPWEIARPGWKYEFPRDHLPHPAFKTEWWYLTGNLHTKEGRRFGYQLTFFRQGIRPPAATVETTSRLICNDLRFAHFAVSDPQGRQYYFDQKISRGSFGEAGFASTDQLAWIDSWSLQLGADESMHLKARSDDASIDLHVVPQKPWVVHGENGISQKADGEGHASHYYSGTRLATTGQIVVKGTSFEVSGTSWFDQEWATNQLAPNQAGWNWFSLQFDDSTELMLYQMRLRDGSIDPASSGTFVAADGTSRHLRRADYVLEPIRTWKSPKTGAQYPIAWKLRVPGLGIEAEISTPLESQELSIPVLTYWEGMVDLHGTRQGRPVKAEGYMELTGYGGALVGLSQPATP